MNSTKLSNKRVVFYPEIQGLRALSVMLVFLFHIWPAHFPGGYIGVDVFFVISGFLITRNLVQEIEKTGSISLVSFYIKRARRLMPVACLVLICTGVISYFLMPSSQLKNIALEIIASTFYVQNWWLATQAVDYLAAENAATPVQHYWSLSIEEQFYLVWPFVLMAVAFIMRSKSSSLRLSIFLIVCLFFTLSLFASISITSANPSGAYFLTHVRIWELALGALLVFIPRLELNLFIHEAMRITGLLLLLISALLFSGVTRFPGYIALIPTVGAALVILAGERGCLFGTLSPLTSFPAQWLGNISYSLYLWHWPLIIFTGIVINVEKFSFLQGGAIIFIALLISAFTKKFVEEQFRVHKERNLAWGKSLIGFSFMFTLCMSVAFVIEAKVDGKRDLYLSKNNSDQYPGAAALKATYNLEEPVDLIPPLEIALDDKSIVYDNGCHLSVKAVELNECVFGDHEADFKVFLIGDSHAVNWLPGLAQVAESNAWRLVTHTKSGCPPLVQPVALRRTELYEECAEWGGKVLQEIANVKPDLVIWGRSAGGALWDSVNNRSNGNVEDIAEAIAEVWEEISQHTKYIVAFVDSPRVPFEPLSCVERDRECSFRLDRELSDDPNVIAQNIFPAAALIDMTDLFCKDGECPTVIGNVLVYRDKGHITKTYSQTLYPMLNKRLLSLLN